MHGRGSRLNPLSNGVGLLNFKQHKDVMQFVNWVILAVVGKLLATGNDLGAAGMSVVINPTGRCVIIWGNA